MVFDEVALENDIENASTINTAEIVESAKRRLPVKLEVLGIATAEFGREPLVDIIFFQKEVI
ncbi:MAG: hypothetical protein M1504_00555 [Candidatus Marsarchaeota archaeon]|nr:hypothetical protein [Candidatus Marsarchaeota archaeon]